MKRRAYLGMLAAGGVGYWAGTNNLSPPAGLASAVGLSHKPPGPSIGSADLAGAPGISSITWHRAGVMSIHIAEQNDMDGFGIKHVDDPPRVPCFIIHKTPRYGGSVHIDFIGRISNSSKVYPTHRFKIEELQGYHGTLFAYHDTGNDGTFTLPLDVARLAPSHFKDVDGQAITAHV